MKTKINRFNLETSRAALLPRAARALLLSGAAAVLLTMSVTVNAAPPPPPTPPPDDYPPTTLPLSGNATVAPESTATPPPATTRITVSTSSKFKGELEADPKTGIVRITNAHPAGDPAARYEVIVTEFDVDNEVIATKYFVLLVETPATCNPVTFAKMSFPAGTSPRSVAIGDFDGDSIQDLAIAAKAPAPSTQGQVTVLLGTGMDNFNTGPNSPIDVGNTPQSIAVGDFDGDGNEDLVTANAGSDNVSVLLGDGTGVFMFALNLPVGDLPRSIAVADFNDDHKQDIAVVNANSDNVSILLGLGTGDFETAVNFPVGRDPFAIAVGDFDRDERQDLAVTVRPINLPNFVSILLNTTPLIAPPKVDFSAATPFGVGIDPISVALGDFEGLNGDSLPDLVTANQSSGDVSVLVGNDNGSFGNPASFPAGASPQSVAVGDFDGNVAQDLVVANGTNTVSVLLSNGGAGGFAAPTAFVAGNGPSSAVVGDFDGDGMQDLAVVNFGSNDVSILSRRCPCPPIITHSTSQKITADNSVSCNLGGPPGSFHMDNSYWRAFDMEMFTGSQPSRQYDVTSVSFGIETAAAGSGVTDQLVMVNLYAQTSGTFPGGTRTSILPNPIPVMVANQAQTILNVPLEATVPAGTSELIMEVFTPNGQPDGNSFFVGSNTAPETGPSYISAASCGITMPTATADLGFPNMHVVFNINGSCAGGIPTPTPTPESQAINLSTRLRVQTGPNVGIGGFIITGSAPKHVLVRGIGPSLAQFGVPDVLADPVLELHGPGGFATISNNNWRDTQEAEIQATGIPPSDNLESAIASTLAPGAYTAILRGNGNTSGVALIELYDLNQAAASKFGNISTRAFVSTGSDIVIAGFSLSNVIGGQDRIIIRGIGPSLAALGVPGVLANPTLELRDGNGALLAANNDWQDNPEQAAELMASGLALSNNLESGIAATLPPGAYTALLAGLNNGTGAGLIEVYDLGPP